MFRILVFLVLIATVVWIINLLFKKWKELSYEHKKEDIQETEAKYTEVSKINKQHPYYEKKKTAVEKFTK